MFRPSGPVAQGIEQQPSKLKVAGSNPAGVANKIRRFLHFPLTFSALKNGWGGIRAESKRPEIRRSSDAQRNRLCGAAYGKLRGSPKGALFLAAIHKLEGNKSAQQLGEFVWAINFQESPDALAVFVSACEQLPLPYGILPLVDAPRWIRRDPNPKS
jgi:hypothetical protein